MYHYFIEPVVSYSELYLLMNFAIISSVNFPQNWVSWLTLPHSSSGLSSDNILL